jgi:superfamily II DNA/RNA helicase
MSIIQVYNKILNTYPFLTEKEERDFIKKAEPFLEKALKTDTPKDKVLLGRSLLAILDNGHADLHTVNPRRAHHKKASELKPSIKLLSKKRILFITIPSWNKSLDGWQKKLADECVKRRKKYDAILIDVRENSGGNSRIAHDFASIFFRRPVMYGTFVSRGKNNRLKKNEERIKAERQGLC